MKKTFALLAALMLVVMMLPTTAMAYDIVSISNDEFTHKLTLTEALKHELEEGTKITYTYTVSNETPTVLVPEGLNVNKAVKNAPKIFLDREGNTSVTFDSNTTFADGVAEKKLIVDWSDVEITEPGVYVWTVNKAIDTTNTAGTNNEHTNNTDVFYLYAKVTVESNGLQCVNGISLVENLTNKNDDLIVEDQYPRKKVELKITKEIQGQMTSKEQFFSFTIALETLQGIYEIDGVEAQTTENAYDNVQTIAQTIDVGASQKGSATIWLKAGQTATIKGLPYDTSYMITENVDESFTVTTTVVGDTEIVTSAIKNTVEDKNLTSDTTVTFTNEKNATIPAGITLQTAAPVMGILLAMSLLAVLYLGKRRESAA